jgi:hypothetical protein
MCCKVFLVPEINNKPPGKWCPHCKPGQGCGIWETRPALCQDFFCRYFFDQTMTEEWRPDRAKFVLTIEPGRTWLSIVTDSENARAWMREPYGSKLRALAAQRISENAGILWMTPTQKFVVTPDEEVLMGGRDAAVEVRFNTTMVAGKRKFAVERLT